MSILLSPPFAFLIYIPLVVLINLLGRAMAGPSQANAMKTSTYGSGEAAPTGQAAPGYKPFFLIALFFAILHLGVLILGTGGLTLMTGIYLLGLVFALLALILG
jgi:NADH:ubiquinone oxidoreductase subunit 3 (subunit A)